MVDPWLPIPERPTPVLFLVSLAVDAGIPYSTQLHLVVPSPGSVVIIRAYSRQCPRGGFDQDSAGESPAPSQV